MGRENDQPGIRELNIQLEELNKAEKRKLVLGSLGIAVTLGVGMVISESLLDIRSAPLLFGAGITAFLIYNVWNFKNYGERSNFIRGQITGIENEARRTATLQRPQN